MSNVPDPTAGPPDDRVYIVDALRRFLIDRWDPSVTYGYDPGVHPEHERFLPIHGGHYDDTIGDPQISVRTASSTSGTVTGVRGFKADGTGSVAGVQSLADVNVWAGSHETIGRDPDPDEVADALGKEVFTIANSSSVGLVDPETSAHITEHIAPRGDPTVGTEPDTNPVVWRAIVEIVTLDSVDPSQR